MGQGKRGRPAARGRPANVRVKRHRTTRAPTYYWEVPSRDRRAGCTLASEPLGTDWDEACRRAATLNAHLESWRTQGASDPTPVVAERTLGWVAREYRASEAYLSAKPGTRREYDRLLDRVLAMEIKGGLTVASVRVDRVGQALVEQIGRRIREQGAAHRGTKGDRVHRYYLQTWRRAWGVVQARHVHRPGHMPAGNPFETVAFTTRVRKTPAATPADLDAFVATADAMGHRSLGTCALVLWRLMQRIEHVVDHLDWADWRPDGRDVVVVEDTKSEDNTRDVSLGQTVDTPEGLVEVRLFADLEARLDETPPSLRTGRIVRRESSGTAWRSPKGDLGHFYATCRKVLVEANLSHLTMRSFRRGGITAAAEIAGDAVTLQAMTGHSDLRSAAGYIDKQALARHARARALTDGRRT